jgi:hypothetical protein
MESRENKNLKKQKGQNFSCTDCGLLNCSKRNSTYQSRAYYKRLLNNTIV